MAEDAWKVMSITPIGQQVPSVAPVQAMPPSVVQQDVPNPWATVGQPQPIAAPKPLSYGEVAKQALLNTPKSAMQFAQDIVQPFIHPIDTATSIVDIGKGVIQKVRELSPPEARGSAPAMDTAAANAVGDFFVKRYGGIENLKNTIATDPVGFASDAAAILTGGGTLAAKAPGMIGKAGSLTASAGRLVDPLTPVVAAGKAVPNVLGFSTGAGPTSINEAFQAGRSGNERLANLLGQMRGTESSNAPVKSAKDAVEKMRQDRANAYREGMFGQQGVTQDKTVLDFKPIEDSIGEIKSRGTFKGQVIDESAAETWQKINEKVNTWKSLNPSEFHTPEGLDALKKAISDIRDSTQYGTPAQNVADNVYQAVKKQIVDQAPTYGKVMEDYEEASKLLREMEKSLSISPNANIDTTVRKLQSILRNNANTNYGRRVELGRELEKTGAADNLFPQLAGQSLSAITPRGLQGIGSAITAGSSALSNPLLLPLLGLTSPRIVGESAAMAGRGAGLVDALRNYPGMDKINPRVARELAYQLGRVQEPTNQELRNILR